MKKTFLIFVTLVLLATTGTSQTIKSQISATADTLWRFLKNNNGSGTATFGFITGADTVFVQGDGTTLRIIAEFLKAPTILMDTNQIKQVDTAVDTHDGVPFFQIMDSIYARIGAVTYWKKVGNKLYPFNLTDSVGIGIVIPEAVLHVEGNTQIGSSGNPKRLTLPGNSIGDIMAYDGVLRFNKTQDTLANGIFYNRYDTTIWAHGMDYESSDFYIWNSGALGDILRLSNGGKIRLGRGGTPLNNIANITVSGTTSDSTAGAFAVINSINSGDIGTPFLFYVRNDGKIKIGASNYPTEILDVTGNIIVRSGRYISYGNGTVTAPAYTFSNALTTGLVANAGAVNRLGFVVDGALSMEISSTTINALSKNLFNFLELGSSNTNARMKADYPSSGDWRIRTGSTDNVLVLKNNGLIGAGLNDPKAVFHIKAGTTAASTSPLKFNSGALNTTAETGAVEFLNDRWYGTITTGALRKPFAFVNDITDSLNLIRDTTGRLRIDINALSAKIPDTLKLSGDISAAWLPNATGTTTIGDDKVTYRMLNDNVISGQTELTTGVEATDEILISDASVAGQIKRMKFSTLSELGGFGANVTPTFNTGLVINDGTASGVSAVKNIKYAAGLATVSGASAEGTAAAFQAISYTTSADAAYTPTLGLARSKSGTFGTVTSVVSGDALGSVVFSGAAGATGDLWGYGAKITAKATETFDTGSASHFGTELILQTVINGATALGDRLKISSAGVTTIYDVLQLNPIASPPATASEGMIYMDTDHHLYVHNGTTWVQLDN